MALGQDTFLGRSTSFYDLTEVLYFNFLYIGALLYSEVSLFTHK